MIGVIELRNKIDGTFTSADLRFLDALSGSIAIAIENAMLYRQLKDSEACLREEVFVLNREIAGHSRFEDLVGVSLPMLEVFRLMERAIRNPVNVLLEGESGTGKELIARAIHYNGPRRTRSFVPVNCGAVPEGLLESELFGHKRGAFTGAVSDRKGLFEVADGGTIFLDEVGDMSPAMQVKLLRVLQDGELMRVGESEKQRHVDVHVISATHRDLEDEIKRGRFREDLFYRLCTFPIPVPALREHADDIPLLINHIVARTAAKFGRTLKGVSSTALHILSTYPWPGNVRELENEIERAAALADDDLIEAKHLRSKVTSKPRVQPAGRLKLTTLKGARTVFEEEHLAEVLRTHHGNASSAAKALGISRVMLQKKIKAYGLRAKLRSPK